MSELPGMWEDADFAGGETADEIQPTSCPRCGSTVKGYMRNSCAAIWGKWHHWHNIEKETRSDV